MKRVRFASAMRSAEGRHSSLIAGSGAILQRLVVRSRAALGRRPGDDPVGILDIAGLAVHAVRRIDLQPASAAPVIHHFVNARRTEALAGVAILPGAALGADAGVRHLQVYRLALLVRIAGKEYE